MEGTLKLGDSTYGGSLVLLSTAVEKGFAIDLKLRKRLTMATKVGELITSNMNTVKL